MISQNTASRLFLIVLLSWMAQGAQAGLITLDLNDFFADPEVTVTAAGDSASFTEVSVAGVSSVLLSNDPGLGDPNIITAGAGFLLMFDFAFDEAAGEDDAFFAAVLDGNGFSAGPAYEFFTQDSASGTVSIDLSALLAEPFLGLQFELLTMDGGLGDSTLTVSNARIFFPDVQMPEASTLLLFLLGVVTLAGRTITRA